ncbi:TPA: conjugal transfer protein TraD, partial [Legionella pneumophila]|nr:conjugal transfer protein TraD [Legionella pneumophila]
MTMLKQIEKEKQNLARCEKSLALEKIKIRKTDTRRKIEFGGLVIKS